MLARKTLVTASKYYEKKILNGTILEKKSKKFNRKSGF